MKVCFITNCRYLGGAERVLLETIDVLQDRGIDCRVLLPGEGALAGALGELGVPYAFVEGGSWVTWDRPSAWVRIKAVARITGKLPAAARIIRKWGCDAIYSNTLTVCNGAILARLLHVPHIWHLHEFGREDHGVSYKFGEAFSNRAIGKLSSACIVVSNALAEKYGRYIAPSKLTVIYPSMHRAQSAGTDSNSASTPVPARSGRFRLVIVGGLVEGKGQADALRAMAYLMQGGADAELFILGEGSPAYRSSLDEIVRSSALADRVRFVGAVTDVLPFLRTADLALVCSRSEGFGRATIEAMLAGKAVVGAASGATPELVIDGFNGLLYRSGDSQDLAAKIRLLMENPILLRKLGGNARTWATTYFTRERYAEEVMAVLSSVVRIDHTSGDSRQLDPAPVPLSPR